MCLGLVLIGASSTDMLKTLFNDAEPSIDCKLLLLACRISSFNSVDCSTLSLIAGDSSCRSRFLADKCMLKNIIYLLAHNVM